MLNEFRRLLVDGITITKHTKLTPKGVGMDSRMLLRHVNGCMEVAWDGGTDVCEVFENERYSPSKRWGSTYPGHLLPTDRSKFSDNGGWK